MLELTSAVLKSIAVPHWMMGPMNGMFLNSSVATAPGWTALATMFRSSVLRAISLARRMSQSFVVP